MNLLLIIISLVITTGYLLTMFSLFGVTGSISETALRLDKKKEGLRMFFTLWTMLAGFPLLIAWINMVDGLWYSFFPFLSCGSLIFVGVASQYNKNLDKQVHFTSAAVCALFAIAFILASGYAVVPIIYFTVFTSIAIFNRNFTYWIEIAALLSTYTTLLLQAWKI